MGSPEGEIAHSSEGRQVCLPLPVELLLLCSAQFDQIFLRHWTQRFVLLLRRRLNILLVLTLVFLWIVRLGRGVDQVPALLTHLVRVLEVILLLPQTDLITLLQDVNFSWLNTVSVANILSILIKMT